MWLFTSGSTGKPKAAVHLHHDFPYNTEEATRIGLRTIDELGLSEADKSLVLGGNLRRELGLNAGATVPEADHQEAPVSRHVVGRQSKPRAIAVFAFE